MLVERVGEGPRRRAGEPLVERRVENRVRRSGRRAGELGRRAGDELHVRESSARERLLREAVPGGLAGVGEVDDAARPGGDERDERAGEVGREGRPAALVVDDLQLASSPRRRGRASCRRN